MTPAAIIVDFDGTILDTEWPEYLKVQAAFADHGLELPIETWEDLVGRADHPHWTELLSEALGGPIDRDSVMAVAKERRARYEVEVLPGVIDVLDAADRAGVALAIASSSPRYWVEQHLDEHGLIDRFVAIRTRDHVDRAKPWPDLYLAACAAVDVDPADALAIEDSRHGCTAARAAGLTCVVVPNRVTSVRPPPDADLLLSSLTEFPFGRFGM